MLRPPLFVEGDAVVDSLFENGQGPQALHSDRGLERLRACLAPKADLHRSSDPVSKGIDFAIRRAIHRKNFVANAYAGLVRRRTVIDVAYEAQPVFHPGDHAHPGIGRRAIRREQPLHVVANGKPEYVGKFVICDRILLEAGRVRGPETCEDPLDSGIDPGLRAF